MRLVDMHLFLMFVVLNGLSYLFSYAYLLDHRNDPVLARTHALVVMYGSAQSFFGFVAGYFMSKWVWGAEADAVDAESVSLLNG